MSGSVYSREIVTEHVEFPSLHLMKRHELKCPELDNAGTIGDPYEWLVPQVLGPLEKCPSSSRKFTDTAV